VRVGFVGLGAGAQHHLSVIADLEGVCVAAVCDLDEGRAQSTAQPIGARPYTDWGSMMEEAELEAVFVCTPPEHHARPTIGAFERGIPVYLEKPLARKIDDGLAIVAAWEASGAVCAVGYQWRSLELLSDLRAALGTATPGLLVSRSIGPTEPTRGDLAELGPGAADRWFADPGRGGGILFELGSHDIDLQLAIAGPVVSVHAAASSGLLALAGRTSTALHDAIAATLRFASGGLGTIHVAWTKEQEPPLYALDIVAAEMSLHLLLDPVFRLEGHTQGGEVLAVGTTNPRRSTLTRFFDAVRHGDRDAVACSPLDALGTLRVTLACERAVTSGQSVAVADVH
jgi:predicted dehydrogenase